MPEPDHCEQLFAYGSLQLPPVQLATFGRTLAGAPDVLPGHRTARVAIHDSAASAADGVDYYLNAEYTGDGSDRIGGMRFDVTRGELEHADRYEAGANYVRIEVSLESGAQAWVYVSAATPA